MFKKNTLFLLGGFIMGVIFLGVAFYTYNQSQTRSHKQIKTEVKSQTGERPEKENMSRIIQQLYLDKALTMEVAVEKTYPGLGFIVTDKQGVKLFVYWKKELPDEGRLISVKGNSYSTAAYIKRLRKEPGFTEDLEDFLKNRPVFISAKQVGAI